MYIFKGDNIIIQKNEETDVITIILSDSHKRIKVPEGTSLNFLEELLEEVDDEINNLTSEAYDDGLESYDCNNEYEYGYEVGYDEGYSEGYSDVQLECE